MVNRIGTVYPCDSNKGFSSKFCVDIRVRHKTPDEGRRTYRPKRCDYDNKDAVSSPNILSNDNYQTSYKKFWQIMVEVDGRSFEVNSVEVTRILANLIG